MSLLLLLSGILQLASAQFTMLSTTQKIPTMVNIHESRHICNIQSWYSAVQNTNVFMLTFQAEENTNAQEADVKSNLISFDSSHKYYEQKTIQINDLSETGFNIYLRGVAASSSSILILSTFYDNVLYDTTYLLYRLVNNYKHDVKNINMSKIKTIKLDNDEYFEMTNTAKLFNSDLYIIVYITQFSVPSGYNNSFYAYFVNEASDDLISSVPALLHSYYVEPWILSSVMAIASSKISEKYLIAFSMRTNAVPYSGWCSNITGILLKNDGTILKSKFLMNQKSQLECLCKLDIISFNISYDLGFYALMYHDRSESPDERLWISILDDFGDHIFNNDTMLSVEIQIGNDIDSFQLSQLELAMDTVDQNKLYLIAVWTYVHVSAIQGKGDLYIQLLQFTWSDFYTEYHFDTVGEPYKVSSTNDPLNGISGDYSNYACVGSIDNQILVARTSGQPTYIYVLSADINMTELSTITPTTISPTYAQSTSPNDPSTSNTVNPTYISTTNHTNIIIVYSTTSESNKYESFSPYLLIIIFGASLLFICISFVAYKLLRSKTPKENVVEQQVQLSNKYQNVNDMKQKALNIQTEQNLETDLKEYGFVDDIGALEFVNIQQELDHYHKAQSDGIEVDKEHHCNVEKCAIFRRNYRNKSHDQFEAELKLKLDLSAEREILDKIHCYYFHSEDIIKTEVDTNIIKNVQSKMAKKYNQVFENQQNNTFNFGKLFCYESDAVEEKQRSTGGVRVKPKYSDLKKELTTNEIEVISISQFVNEYKKACYHFECKFRKIKFPNIEKEHILSIMIYCNFDTLQFEFSKTYRENIEKHNEFYYLGKLL
eukprot:150247_1